MRSLAKLGLLISSLILGACSISAPNPESAVSDNVSQVIPLERRSYQDIKVQEKTLNVEVVSSAEAITLGLSYRDEIGADGMLFVMPQRSMPGFWMRGMRFPLDIVWIDCLRATDCAVADITPNVPVPDDPNDLKNLPSYQPKVSATHVLELEEGQVAELGISVGDSVTLYE